MTEQEKINAEVQTKLALQDAKFNAFVEEMREFKTEMRNRDNQRAEDMREIRASFNNIQNRIDDMGKHVRNLSLTAMGAIGAMVVTVIISLLKN